MLGGFVGVGDRAEAKTDGLALTRIKMAHFPPNGPLMSEDQHYIRKRIRDSPICKTCYINHR